MKIVFVDEGVSNRALIAKSLYMHIVKNSKKKKMPKAYVATTGKNKSLHMKGLKSLKEFGLSVSRCSRKDVKHIKDVKVTGKTQIIILGQDNDKEMVKKVAKKNKTLVWAIDNPICECKNEVKLRFFRRVRDQLWVELENLVYDIYK